MLAILGTVGGLFGLKGKVALAIGGLVLLLAAGGVLWGLKALYDHNVIAAHDARQEAATTKADRAADANAATERRADDNRLQSEAAELGKVTNDAQNDRDRRVARQRCIRLQQSARAAGRQSPACS